MSDINLLQILGQDDPTTSIIEEVPQETSEDPSKVKKGKGSKKQKEIDELARSAGYFTANTKATKRQRAPIKEVYQPSSYIPPPGAAENRKQRAKDRLTNDKESREHGFILTKQPPLDELDVQLQSKLDKAAIGSWKSSNDETIRTTLQVYPSDDEETFEWNEDSDDESTDSPPLSPSKDTSRRETILMYPSRLSQAFADEGEPTPQIYQINNNTSVLYSLPSEDDGTVSPESADSPVSHAVFKQLIFPYRRAIAHLEHEFRVLRKHSNTDYAGLAKFRDSLWRKFKIVNEIVEGVMNNFDKLHDRMNTIEFSDAFRSMIKNPGDQDSSDPEALTSDNFRALGKQVTYLANSIGETNDLQNAIYDQVFERVDNGSDSPYTLNIIPSFRDQVNDTFSEIRLKFGELQDRLEASIADASDSRTLSLEQITADFRTRLQFLEQRVSVNPVTTTPLNTTSSQSTLPLEQMTDIDNALQLTAQMTERVNSIEEKLQTLRIPTLQNGDVDRVLQLASQFDSRLETLEQKLNEQRRSADTLMDEDTVAYVTSQFGKLDAEISTIKTNATAQVEHQNSIVVTMNQCRESVLSLSKDVTRNSGQMTDVIELQESIRLYLHRISDVEARLTQLQSAIVPPTPPVNTTVTPPIELMRVDTLESQMRTLQMLMDEEQRTLKNQTLSVNNCHAKVSEQAARMTRMEDKLLAATRPEYHRLPDGIYALTDPGVMRRIEALESKTTSLSENPPTDLDVVRRLAVLEERMASSTTQSPPASNISAQSHVVNNGTGSVYSTPSLLLNPIILPPTSQSLTLGAASSPVVTSRTSLLPPPTYIQAGDMKYDVPPVGADPLFARSFNMLRPIHVMNSRYLREKGKDTKTTTYDLSYHKFNFKVDDSLKFEPDNLTALPTTLSLAFNKFNLSGMLEETDYVVWDSTESRDNLEYIADVHASRLYFIFLVIQTLVGRTVDLNLRATYSQILVQYGREKGDRASGVEAIRLLRNEVYGTSYGARAIAVKNLIACRQDLGDHRRLDNRAYLTLKKELISSCANFNMSADDIYRVMFLDGMSVEHSDCYRQLLHKDSLPTIDEMYASMDINQSAITQAANQGKLSPMSIVTIEDAKRLGNCFAISGVSVRRSDDSTTSRNKSPRHFKDSDTTRPICPYHSQLLSHKNKSLRHDGPCYLLQNAAEANLSIQEYIANRNKTYKSNPIQVPHLTQSHSRSASPSKYGPSRHDGPSPKRYRSKSKSPKRGGGALSASIDPPVTGGSHA